ncbi:MAG: endonuclease/exonuclease/phosphatase family protein [Clostridiales bacterium]|nr:endonuclease/exonuclease/phosphatase family protein [Clostridiales bacterium]
MTEIEVQGQGGKKPKKQLTKGKKAALITAFTAVGLVVLFVLTVVIYLLYVICGYYRLEDNLPLEVSNNIEVKATTGTPYTVMTYNVGFGAYSPEYTFFMDTGIMKDGTPTQGKYGKAISKADVEKNIGGSSGIVKEHSPDFAIIQEVDYDSSRSYGVDERVYFSGLAGYASTLAVNYHSSYLFYPFGDPHGKNNAGIMTLSKYRIADSTRYAFPIADGFSKFTDLDRCFSITHIPVENGGTLSVISLHMSAYDEGGVIRKQQAELLKGVLTSEYEKGYYVIAGGDFNQDLIGNLEKFPSDQQVPPWVNTYDQEDIPAHFSIVADTNSEVGSCRGADVVWERGKDYTCVIDGFIVSDNVTVEGVQIIDTDFAFSDHNPVKMTFVLG